MRKELPILRLEGNHNKMPAYARPGDAGFDLRAVETTVVPAHSRRLIKTGWAVAVPEGYELQVRPRSGNAFKHGVTVLNSPGTIDSGYRGEIGVLLYNSSDTSYEILYGTRVAQAVLAPVVQAIFMPVDRLDETERGDGGFGHTGEV